jgi:nicotinamide riboside kinase
LEVVCLIASCIHYVKDGGRCQAKSKVRKNQNASLPNPG